MTSRTFFAIRTKHAVVALGILLGASSVMGCGASGGAGGAQIAMKNYQFAPQTLYAHPGEITRLVVRNDDAVSHTFTIQELGVNQNIPARGNAVVEFTPQTTGVYALVCLPHPNMRGTIEVKP
ncbi:MAG: cupredoxin domain-containing protein [Anaerolineae bacterium]|nr:cupredoxin domain-containing protein [Anaerolineae bacterium]